MKVVFIYLPRPYLKQPDSQIPLGVLYLAAILEQNNIEVEVKNYSSFQTEDAIADIPEADVYGITISSMELLQANEFAGMIKDKYPGKKVGIGGPGTITPEYIDWNTIDFACQGEAEEIILDILDDAEQNSLQRIYKGKPVADLDSLPLPARHLLDGNLGGNVFMNNHNYRDGGSTVLLTARGCPYKCAFCANPWLTEKGGGSVRFRSPENVRREIEDTIERYGIKQFRMSDDLFTISKKRVVEMCEMLHDLDITWRVSARAKPFNYEIAKIIRDAGCREASFGIESFDDDVLTILKKGITAKENAEALEAADKAGLKARVLLMIGTPGQTSKTVDKNIEWLEKVPYGLTACTLFRPMPGSDIWENPEDYGVEIINKNIDDLNFYFYDKKGERPWKNIIKIKGRTLEEVEEESMRFRAYLKSTGRLNTG